MKTPIQNQTFIEALVAALEKRELSPQIWEKHGRLRIYIRPALGKKFAKAGKCFYEYPEIEDQLGARDKYDGSLPPSNGTRMRIWHPKETVARWAREQMRPLFMELSDPKTIAKPVSYTHLTLPTKA